MFKMSITGPLFFRKADEYITGFGGLEASLGGKWLELLSEIAPGLKRAAVMFNPDTISASLYLPSLRRATRHRARALRPAKVCYPAVLACRRGCALGALIEDRNPSAYEFGATAQ